MVAFKQRNDAGEIPISTGGILPQRADEKQRRLQPGIKDILLVYRGVKLLKGRLCQQVPEV